MIETIIKLKKTKTYRNKMTKQYLLHQNGIRIHFHHHEIYLPNKKKKTEKQTTKQNEK